MAWQIMLPLAAHYMIEKMYKVLKKFKSSMPKGVMRVAKSGYSQE